MNIFEYLSFSHNPLLFGKSIEQPSIELIKNTLGLVNCGIEDAVKYGGELTRECLSKVNFRNDRKYVIVDTKVHMLMPGFSPAIPGFHVDGTPRGKDLNPLAKEDPRIDQQLNSNLRSPRYHILATGTGCLTEFINEKIDLLPNKKWETSQLFEDITRQIEKFQPKTITVPSCQFVEFDWWHIHRGNTATKHEWRFLIRVAETDFIQPETDLRKIIRTQQQVYVSEKFGW